MFEFEDHDWFPQVLRNYQMSFLGLFTDVLGIYRPAGQLLEQSKAKKIVDLASGSGFPALNATYHLRKKGLKLTLTDKYPVWLPTALNTSYNTDSVEVINDAWPNSELYTMFNAFHHFALEEKLEIFRKAHLNKARLLIFEPLQPNISTFVKVFFSTAILPFFLAPFMKPFRFSNLLFTYLIPLGILVTWWDGLASVMRSVSSKDLDYLQSELKKDGIQMEVRFIKTKFAILTFIHSGWQG